MTYDEIESAALELDPEERIRLADMLWRSLYDSLSLAWATESVRRLRELEAGTATEVPLDEVFRRARAAIVQDS